MGKVQFSIKYSLLPGKNDEYLKIVKELKNLIDSDGLESYTVYTVKGKPDTFQEVYTFANKEDYEEFDDDPNERVDILMNKLSELIKGNTTEYSTLFEIEEEV